ncbi:MAG TPA: acyl-CoA desaturase [Gemmatimonadales bacterium]|nr:acyl-CoA desaturase [Gemmatimonadales bacterium]
MAVRTVTFASRECEAFVREVKQRHDEYFRNLGISNKANAAMVTKTVVLIAAMVLPYLAIMILQPSPWIMWALAAFMGVAMAGIGFSVAHDALHGAYSESPVVNGALGACFDVLGANGYMWKVTHNVIHHTYTNINGLDEDLEVSPLLRLSVRAPHRKVHRFQHLYALGAYAMSTLNWVFWKDFDYFTRRRLGPYEGRRHAAREWVFLALGKGFYFTWAIVLPLTLLDLAWWQVAIGFLTMNFVASIILGVVFQLAHVVEGVEQLVPDEHGMMEHSWMVHEMLTTANFSTHNRLLTWYVGGLNYQVEHHLFPKTCSVHYPALGKIVREVALKHGIPYRENPTFFGAVRSHFAMLKLLGQGYMPAAV